MSCTTMYAMARSGKPAAVFEYRNGWGFGPYVWDKLCRAYEIPSSSGRWEQWPLLWKADREGTAKLKPFERSTLFATYDNVIVERADFNQLARDFRSFVIAHPPVVLDDLTQPPKLAYQVAHLAAMADDLESLASKRAAKLVCWHGTSVSENPWTVWNEERGVERRYDFRRDDKHWAADIRGLHEEAKQAARVMEER